MDNKMDWWKYCNKRVLLKRGPYLVIARLLEVTTKVYARETTLTIFDPQDGLFFNGQGGKAKWKWKQGDTIEILDTTQ